MAEEAEAEKVVIIFEMFVFIVIMLKGDRANESGRRLFEHEEWLTMDSHVS